MVARNFEDLLQCSFPVFNCLLPEPHNGTVLQLLFTMAHWHRLAKLHMHSDLTLEIMDQVTTVVSKQFCHFKATVCSAYVTHKLHQEAEAHTRHHAKQAAKQQGGSKGKQKVPLVFNFQTYKFHVLGDYVLTIHQYGMCDSYSTEPVSP
ncbi:uncharacterized protein BJ212DRAFT_1445347 [Suillus subaureus]|uniref:Uncharacterized protein n=1 Tax=Suillus subaureus TaxID=48587 RepID=A0A9P7EHF0_9AGAM|nr:uncharacterized protein BJ212DRAFT_1445347 [Suillus subaureus]KAG1821944.1 hypothetical protein BJ212DRAFT_1445347 [Suillus subaureus]